MRCYDMAAGSKAKLLIAFALVCLRSPRLLAIGFEIPKKDGGVSDAASAAARLLPVLNPIRHLTEASDKGLGLFTITFHQRRK